MIFRKRKRPAAGTVRASERTTFHGTILAYFSRRREAICRRICGRRLFNSDMSIEIDRLVAEDEDIENRDKYIGDLLAASPNLRHGLPIMARNNTKIPGRAAADGRLTAGDLRVLVAICRCVDMKTDSNYIKRETIAKLTGIAKNHISTYTANLVRHGYLEKAGSGGQSRPAFYQVIMDINPVLGDSCIESKNSKIHRPNSPEDGTGIDTLNGPEDGTGLSSKRSSAWTGLSSKRSKTMDLRGPRYGTWQRQR